MVPHCRQKGALSKQGMQRSANKQDSADVAILFAECHLTGTRKRFIKKIQRHFPHQQIFHGIIYENVYSIAYMCIF